MRRRRCVDAPQMKAAGLRGAVSLRRGGGDAVRPRNSEVAARPRQWRRCGEAPQTAEGLRDAAQSSDAAMHRTMAAGRRSAAKSGDVVRRRIVAARRRKRRRECGWTPQRASRRRGAVSWRRDAAAGFPTWRPRAGGCHSDRLDFIGWSVSSKGDWPANELSQLNGFSLVV